MGREGRMWMEGAYYHVMVRGNRKQVVFRDEEDFSTYLALVRRAKRKFATLLYAYCLMPNHVHLLVGPRQGEIVSAFMRWISRGYASYFNKKYALVGHLWQGRFRSKTISDERYLATVARYIEENPIRAGLASEVSGYRWTSCGMRYFAFETDIVDSVEGAVGLIDDGRGQVAAQTGDRLPMQLAPGAKIS